MHTLNLLWKISCDEDRFMRIERKFVPNEFYFRSLSHISYFNRDVTDIVMI